VVEGEVSVAADLVTDSLASSTVTRSDHVGVTRGDGHRSKVRLLAGLVGIGGLLAGRTLELGEIDLAGARDCVRRGLEVLLLGEEEDDGACLARVGSGDIKVED
jgi:hypothetical protein